MRLLLVIFLSFQSFSDDVSGSISIEKVGLDSSWDFIQADNSSFQRLENEHRDITLRFNKFILGFSDGFINLKAERATYPKNIDSSMSFKGRKIGLQLTQDQQFILTFKNQNIDDQYFDCYQRGSLIIGNCIDSDIQISTTIEKYQQLDGALIFIKGQAKESSLEYIKKFEDTYLDQMYIRFKQQDIAFNWLTPLEDIRSPIILGATINGEKVGDVINEILTDLPPRRDWVTNTISLGVEKEKNFQAVNVYVNNQILYGFRQSFDGDKRHNRKFNNILESGANYKFRQVDISIFFRHYLKFHLWENDIYYSGRTAKYFNNMFAELGVKIKFSFK